MKAIQFKIYFLFIGLVFFISCSKKETPDQIETPENVSLHGFVQKGPFIVGTNIMVSELDKNLNATGRVFNTVIDNNNGEFSLPNISLKSPYVELMADGFYYNENAGQLSSSRLILYSIVDTRETQNINVNLFTHLEKKRVKYLIAQGKSFSEAKNIAFQNILNLFEIKTVIQQKSEFLDITRTGNANGILLAASVILQGMSTVADMSQLLANISNDIELDGTVENALTKTLLAQNAIGLNVSTIRSNLEKRYTEMGASMSIPDFEAVVTNFKTVYENNYTSSIEYPAATSIGENILARKDGDTMKANVNYTLAAKLADKNTLKIVIQKISGSPWFYAPMTVVGWQVSNYDFVANEQVFTATVKNQTLDVMLKFPDLLSSYQIIYYEDNSATPTKSKTIHVKPFSIDAGEIPVSGKFGTNILATKNNAALSAGVYSVTSKMNLAAGTKAVFQVRQTSGTGKISVDINQNQNWTSITSGWLFMVVGTLTTDVPLTLEGTGTGEIELPNTKIFFSWK